MPVPESFLCPITSEIMSDPVSTSDGFSYEREAIAEWLAAGNSISPLTGAVLTRAELTPNHALRQAIQQHIDEHPDDARDLYRSSASNRSAVASQWAVPASSAAAFPSVDLSATEVIPSTAVDATASGSAATVSDAVPVGLPIQPSSSHHGQQPVVQPVQPPPPPPLTGLRDEERAAAAPYAVTDWAAHIAALKPRSSASGGWLSGLMGGRGSTPRGTASSGTPDEEEPRLRASTGGGGGVVLEAEVHSAPSMLRLARRLVASDSAPVRSLTVRAKEGFGPGTAAPLAADGDGFLLLCRALCVGQNAGAASLGMLRELTFTQITVSDASAEALGCALSGHPTDRKSVV